MRVNWMSLAIAFSLALSGACGPPGTRVEGELEQAASRCNSRKRDCVPPVIAIVTPSAGASLTGSVTVSGTASDNVAVQRVEVSVDDGAFQLASGATHWSLALGTLAPGPHRLAARATDVGGLRASAAVAFTITAPGAAAPDETPPDTSSQDVALPIPPRDYAIPAGGLLVNNGQQLVSALASMTVRDIVLADGIYTTVGTTSSRPYFAAATGHRLWAARRGGAVLQAGLMLGGNYGAQGAEVHGLHFDISDRALTYGAAALYVWGAAGVGAKVFDTTVEGHYALVQGIELRQVQDTVVQRVVVKHVRRVGVYVSDCCDDNWFDNSAQARTLTDIDVEGVREVVPGSTDGKSEFGIWVGNRVINPVERLRAEHTWWSGLWTGSSSRDTVFRDITITTVDRENGNAIYAEHRTINNTFERFRLGPDLNHGIICEWNFGSGAGACEGNIFRDGTIASRKSGIFLDEGQVANTVTRVRFANQTCAAIVNNRGVANVFTENDFTAIAPGAEQVGDYCY